MDEILSKMSLEELWQLFPVILVEHREEWAQWYAEELKKLKQVTRGIDCRFSHIGSTAVKGIMAKPTVDILVEVKPQDWEATAQRIGESGYRVMYECETRVSFNKGYTENGFAERVFHLHLRLTGDNDEIYFRDYLNENSSEARAYEALKLKLRKQFEHNRDAYTNAKTDFVRERTKRARALYGDRY